MGPASTGAATCCDEKQIFRQKEDVVLVSNIEVLLLASVWGCDGGGVGVCVSVVLVFLCSVSWGFVLLCCCTSGSPL